MNKIHIPHLSTGLGFRLVLLVLAAALAVAMAASPALAQVTQETEQEGESGEVGQSGDVRQDGDNSNQCVGLQQAANSGNAQNVIGIESYLSQVDDYEFEEVGSDITVSPANSTECTQEVNQAASASADEEAQCWWYWYPDGMWCWWPPDGSWWGPYTYYYPVSDVAAGALGTTGGLTALGILGALGLVGTGALVFRSRRRS